MARQQNISKRYLKPRWDFLTQNNKGTLEIEGIPVTDIAKKYGTPVYVMVESKIRKKIRKFLNAFPYAHLRVQYACKVNSNLELMRIMREEGLELDASSVGEIILGLLADFRPDQITFTNLYKTEQDILFAAQIGVQAITADSIEELERIIEVGQRTKQKIRVFLRFNPMIELGKYTTKKQKYGITPDLAKKAINLAIRSNYAELVGFHFHGSYITNPEVYKIAARKLMKYAKYCHNKGVVIQYIDLGGGFPFEDEGKKYFAPGDMGEDFIKYFKELLKEYKLPAMKLIFEPGKSLVMNAGVGIIKIISKKWHSNKLTLVTDGSTYGFVPDVLIYKEKYDILPATKMDKPRIDNVRISGCTCDCLDVISQNSKLPKVEPGDMLAIMDIGAYSNVMASNFNNVRRAPMVLIKENGSIKLIRRRDRYSEMFAPELDVLKVADPKELKGLYNLFRVNVDKFWRGKNPLEKKTRRSRKKAEESTE